MHKTNIWFLVGAAAVIGAAALEAQRGVPPGASLPSGITELAPSPPSGSPPDPGAVTRGTVLYETSLGCAACHGLTGRGGPNNSPDLTRSAIAMAPDEGLRLGAFLRTGRPDKGMPPVAGTLTASQTGDLSAKLRSFGFEAALEAQAGGRGGRGGLPAYPAALAGQQLSIVVGDPALGKKFFNGQVGQCASCHAVVDGQASPASNLAHIASKYPDPKMLQNNMLLNRDNSWSPRIGKDVTATITYADGRTVKGYLTSVSDFKVVVRDENGAETVIARSHGEPKVVLADRLQHHLDLLSVYLDDDIHNLTAYLVTLK